MDLDHCFKLLRNQISPLESDLVEWRRHFHQYPELRFEEYSTAEFISDQLIDIGLHPKRLCKTGILALLEGSNPGPTVAIRADMDALPMQDIKEVPYKSNNPGVTHACGHDVHMAVALGVAKALEGIRKHVAGNIKFIFQPAEEIPSGEVSGARSLIEEGVLDAPKVEAILGFHCWPELQVANIGFQNGCTMASADSFSISIEGKASHAGTPQFGKDAISAAAHLITAIQTLLSREISPNEVYTVNIGTINGGHSQSIVCDLVEMTGTLRTANDEVRDYIIDRLHTVTNLELKAMGCNGLIQFTDHFPPVINNEYLLNSSVTSLRTVFPPDQVVELKTIPMTAEDFSFYLDLIPGLYLKLGVGRNSLEEDSFPLHDPRFDIDEQALQIGALGMSAVLLTIMNALTKRDI